MAPVGGRPFLEIVLDRLDRAGCRRVILSTGHLHNVIFDHFGEVYRTISLRYAVEDEPLGTGGAIHNALKLATRTEVIILNGDTLLDVDYRALLLFHAAAGSELSLCTVERDDISRYGGLTVKNDRVVSFIEKGQTGRGLINAGVYVMNSGISWPADVPAKFSFETDYLMSHVERLQPAAFQCNGYFLDIGIPEDLDKAQMELASIE